MAKGAKKLRMKRESHKVCARVGASGMESDHFFFTRKAVKWVRGEMMERGRAFSETGNVRKKGRVRTVVVVRHKSAALSTGDDEHMCNDEEIEVVKNGVGGEKHIEDRRSGCIRNGIIRESGVKKWHGIINGDVGRGGRREGAGNTEVKRRRRRKVVELTDLQLLKNGELKNWKNGRSGPRDGKDGRVLGRSDKEKFNRSIKEFQMCTSNLGCS